MSIIKSDQVPVFEATVKLVTKAALAMPGCQAFMMLASLDNDGHYVLYEEWDTAEHANAFKQSSARNEAVAKLAPAMASAPETIEYEAQRSN